MIVWAQLLHRRALQVLHNPRDAGAFVHGRHRTLKNAEARVGRATTHHAAFGLVLAAALEPSSWRVACQPLPFAIAQSDIASRR